MIIRALAVRRLALALGLGVALAARAADVASAPPSAAAARGRFSVRDYGAAGDGRTLDTGAINRAFEACAGAGGGQVVLPPGDYLSGTIRLKGHTTFFLEPGATLIGCTNLEAYQEYTPPAGTPEAAFRSHWHRALLLGEGVEDLAIMGSGVIDGNRVFDPRGEERMRGPHTILLGQCRRVTRRDFSLRDSANYAVLLEDCQQVEARGLRITGGWDGIHFRGWPGRPCREVAIAGCDLFMGDDAIAGRYWENVLIKDCVLNSSCNGFRLIGPASHLIIYNCLFYGPGVHPHRSSGRHNMLAGLNLQPGAWDATEGTLGDVLISDVTMHNVSTPFHFVLKPGNTAGRIEVNRVTATGVYRCASSVESWAATPFTNVVFRDVTVEFDAAAAHGSAPTAVKPPGVDARPLPAWGFFARNIQRLVLDHVRLSCAGEETRPALIAQDVERLSLAGFRFTPQPAVPEGIVLSHVRRVDSRDAESSSPKPSPPP